MVDLVLDPSKVLTSGVQRDVFFHPFDRYKLIKVLKPQAQLSRRNNFNGIFDRLFPSTRIRQIRKEYQEYLRIMLQHPEPQFHLPISHMFGFVTTNLGLGCLTERIADQDGALGKTLSKKVKSGTLTDDDVAALNTMIAEIFDNGIRAGDLNASNIVFGHRDFGNGPGEMECVLVDGFGDIHAVPVRSWGRSFNRLGLDDGCRRLAKRTGLRWDKSTRLFSYPDTK